VPVSSPESDMSTFVLWVSIFLFGFGIVPTMWDFCVSFYYLKGILI
jgi:hypothetical protein